MLEEECWIPCVVDDLNDNLLQKLREAKKLKAFKCSGLICRKAWRGVPKALLAFAFGEKTEIL